MRETRVAAPRVGVRRARCLRCQLGCSEEEGWWWTPLPCWNLQWRVRAGAVRWRARARRVVAVCGEWSPRATHTPNRPHCRPLDGVSARAPAP
eukprot:6517200-Prymnesium_polylepis.1